MEWGKKVKNSHHFRIRKKNNKKLYIKFHFIIFYLFILAQLNISACDGTSATDTLPLIVIIRFVQRWYLFIKNENPFYSVYN